MATILIRRPHALPMVEVRKRAEHLARRIEQRLKVSWGWDGNRMHLTAPDGAGRGARGEVHVHDREVRIQVTLPLVLAPMKRVLEGRLHQKLDALLG